MKTEQKYLDRIELLIKDGYSIKEEVHQTREGNPIKITEWMMSANFLIEQIFSKDNSYLKAFSSGMALQYQFIDRAIGILSSIRNELKFGLLEKSRKLIENETLTDFLSQAEYTLENGRGNSYISSGLLIGSVLERKLRLLCRDNNMSDENLNSISSLSKELTKENIISESERKQFEVVSDMRNNVIHGKWEKVNERLVKRSLDIVIDFISY